MVSIYQSVDLATFGIFIALTLYSLMRRKWQDAGMFAMLMLLTSGPVFYAISQPNPNWVKLIQVTVP
jgi:hypothetical protein